MTGFTDRFGGSTLQAAEVAYAAVALTLAATPTVWPSYATGGVQVAARLMDVSPSTTGLSLNLPDATLTGPGQDVFVSNPGSASFVLQDFMGNPLATVQPGQQRYLYLTDNTTQAGTWRSILMGVGAGALDAASAAGSGLKAIGSTLNQSSPSATINASLVLQASDRAKLYVNTGGSITATLPLSSAVGNDYFLELRNQGTGALTLAGSGGEPIDGSASIVLQIGDSCFVQAGVGAWYTIGRGRNTQFNFTQLLKTVTGGTTPLSLTEASNVVQTYSGALTSNQTVVLPSVVQVYYVSNNTTGGFAFTLQTATPGSVLSIPSGQAAVVFCDGTNVINVSTSSSGASAILLGAGSVTTPSLGLGVANTGLYAPNSTTVAVTANGVEQVRWSGGQALQPGGTLALPSYSFTAHPDSGLFYDTGSAALGFSVGGTEAAYLTGTTLFALNFSGNYKGTLDPTITINGAGVGYIDLPQNSQSAAYTLVAADAGKHLLHPTADVTARTFTIPANSAVAYPVGTALTFVNQHGAGVVTIAINTDAMYLAGAGTTGSRTLAANGVATALKVAATEWLISGTGLT